MQFQRYESPFLYNRKSIFPLPLQTHLRTLDSWTRSPVTPSKVSSIVEALSELPPDAIMIAGEEIPVLASLHHSYQLGRNVRHLRSINAPEVKLLEVTDQLELLYIFHKDGRFREAALRKMVDPLPSPFFVAAVAYRLNDWAHEVRVVAQECLDRILPCTDPTVVATASMYLLSQMWQWQRAGDCLQTLQTALCHSDVMAALADLLRLKTTGPIGRTFRNAMRFEEMDKHLVRLSKDAVSPAARYVASEALMDGRARWSDGYQRKWIDKSMSLHRRIPRSQFRPLKTEVDVAAQIKQAASDPAIYVRKLAAQKLIEHRHRLPAMTNLAVKLAQDKSEAVKERASFYLLKTGT